MDVNDLLLPQILCIAFKNAVLWSDLCYKILSEQILRGFRLRLSGIMILVHRV